MHKHNKNNIKPYKSTKRSKTTPGDMKSNAVRFTDFRTSLICHVTKTLLNIIMFRKNAAIDREIAANPGGFRKEREPVTANSISE